MNSASERVPARTSSLSRHTSVPQPSAAPRKVPVSIGPPGTTTAGRSTEAAAISSEGMVLSQPPSNTTPSIGLARSISSVAIAAMFRQSIAVGRTEVSPSETTGRLSGIPPASYTPCFTLSATSLRCELHGVRSDAVLAIAMWGRPSKAWAGRPRRIQARWMYALRSVPPYHCALRCFTTNAPLRSTDDGLRRGSILSSPDGSASPPLRRHLVKRFHAVPASEERYGLGEGPFWDGDRNRVLWVDINAGAVHAVTPAAQRITHATVWHFPETVGAVVCSRDGELLVAGARRLRVVSPEGAVGPGPEILPERVASRLNDGGCDPAGRFLVGSLALDDRAAAQVLVQVGADGQVVVIDDDLGMSNGLAFSPA